MRKLTDHDLIGIIGSTIEGYRIEAARAKRGAFINSNHYGIVLGRNSYGHYVTWQFHLLEDESVSVYWGHYYMEDREGAIEDFNTRDLDTPRKFRVTITETSKMTIEVEADDQQQAEQIVSDGWHRSEYVLDADNFVGVEFEAVPVVDAPDVPSVDGI